MRHLLTFSIRRRLLAASLSVVLGAPAAAQSVAAPADSDALPAADRVLLAEVARLARDMGDSVWSGWHAAPRQLILVTPAREYLLWPAQPSVPGFRAAGYDSLLATPVLVRQRVFPPGLQATFPVNGEWTVVIGRYGATSDPTPAAWVLTALHEHFHQWQGSQPEYLPRVKALDLARGDSTGMWMLNYPFPYDSQRVDGAFAELSAALKAAARATGGAARADARVRDAWQSLRAVLDPAAQRYLAFQLWYEGIARYTQVAMARLAAQRPSNPEFVVLAGASPYAIELLRLQRQSLENELDLAKTKRETFYPFGGTVGLWLDRAHPGWRAAYLRAMPVIVELDPGKWGEVAR